MSPPILDPIRGALLRSQPDAKLVALVREGRERAFEEIVRRYRAPLVGFAAMVVSADRADDVVQEALLSAYDSMNSSGSAIVLRPWLFRIVRNRALNQLRDHPTDEQLTEDLDSVRGPAEIAEQREQVAALVGGLQALPAAQRDAILARELEGRGHAEIAAELGTSPGAVRQLIFRARGTLRQAAGVLIPLPALRFLLGSGGAEAGAAGATGAGLGAAAATGGGAAATGVATKIAVGIAGVALAVGGGIAVERNRGGDGPGGGAERDEQALAADEPSGGGGATSSRRGDGSSSGGHDGGGGAAGSGGDDASRGDGGGGGGDGAGGGGSSGHGGGGSSASGTGDSGSSGHGGDEDDFDDDSSGSGSGDFDDGDFEDDFDDDSSGSGSSGSGSSGSGISGSGSSGSGSSADFEEPEIEIDDDDSSGSGSGSDDDG
jgi:RNA polymerase sigma factor (sigma-70 family)